MKKNYLIVMPRFVNDETDGYIFPLGILYVSSALKDAGFSVFTLNLNHAKGTIEDAMRRKIESHNIDVVMTGGVSAQYNAIRMIVDAAQKAKPEILMVVGGGIISAEPSVAMDALEFVDYGVIGEGELTSIELCNYIDNGGDRLAIHGLIYADSDTPEKYVMTRYREEIKDLNNRSWPDYEGFDYEKNLNGATGLFSFSNKRMAYVISSRSCPYRCTFCFHTSGKKYRQRTMDDLFKELDYLIDRFKIDECCFADELFARDVDRMKEFCERITAYDVTWNANFRVDDVTPEMIELIEGTKSCSWMGFGLESADNRILESMRKNITIEKTEKALQMCYDAGIPIQGTFIFGDINETVETSENSLKWLRENQEKYNVKVAHVVPYPGTYIYKDACKRGIIDDPVKYLRNGCPQINISKLADNEYYVLTQKVSEIAAGEMSSSGSFEIYNMDNTSGFISVRGTCGTCGHQNDWKVRLFKYSFMVCGKCGQKFATPLNNATLLKNIETNIADLTNLYGKVALWGMGDHMVSILRQSTILKNDNVFPVDISESKQGRSLFETPVYCPEIINDESISTVIISAAMHVGIIESQIKVQFPKVKNILDISHFI